MEFKEQIKKYFDAFFHVISTEKQEWTVKGFIDVYKNIYTISTDTKVISKIVELMIFPIFVKFAHENNYEMILSKQQNHYPDLTFINKKNRLKYALDIKSSYRAVNNKINGMTLGAFTGYFRNRHWNKNITFPYQEYEEHYVLGIIYTKTDLYNCQQILKKYKIKITKKILDTTSQYLMVQDDNSINNFANALGNQVAKLNIDVEKILIEFNASKIDERKTYKISNLDAINSVVRDFEFFIHEKWRIAKDGPGSGNTKNIGSTNKIDELINGLGIFTKYKNGKQLFDAYWQAYLTKDMAKAIDLEKPHFKNLKTYFEYIKTLPSGK
ncbi:Restriction endonuclease [Candidatus Magnetomoraceae bacterium gMMP-15]